ncbi:MULTISPECIES: prepilin-type N-terminal cleavage/methylation domain-containing protein [Clostridioides]|uniref:prepilin-type N-terminal cleavage/methylation domain-containing protein n=1 Tax=Clostridioides sp. ZZV14-6153 TaxID=2811494 RepID=UPI001D11EDBD|nr:prepilin-type N-terminal cleavage/methylation domain-containing protein [Clostridioides sp. ZZV14-6153]
MKNKKGFTLVELLVVIAIIGILAIVALPALFKNIEKAKIAKLESDISAIKSASLSYYADESKFTDGNSISWSKKDGKIIINGGLKDDPLTDKIEGLGMPYNGSYVLSSSGGHEGHLELLIVPDGEISKSGTNKLEEDYGNSIKIYNNQGRITIKITFLNGDKSNT